MLGRACPDLPCDAAFDDDEWQSVYAVVKGEAPPVEPPSMGAMVKVVASLGGYLGRKGDGEPGPKAMWIGMQRMADLASAWRAHSAHAAGAPRGGGAAKPKGDPANRRALPARRPPDPQSCA